MTGRFTVSEDNRLVIKAAGGATALEGSFTIAEDNSLVYIFDEPVQWSREEGFKDKVSFKGKWSLNSNYDLQLRLKDTTSENEEEVLTLRGEIISAQADKITFGIKSHNKNNQAQFRILTLGGVWGVDECNRIIFNVTQKGPPDTLTLQGAWQLNKNQEIIYTYEKEDLKSGKRSSYSITFKGYWEIAANQRLTYILSTVSACCFDFRVQLETPNIYPKEGVIKYRIGIGVKEITPQAQRVITLYGAWKFSRNLGLVFDMEYARREFHACHFGAEVDLSRRDEIIFSASSPQGEPLGFNLIFTHRFLEKLDAQAYLRLKKLGEEYGAQVGIKIPF